MHQLTTGDIHVLLLVGAAAMPVFVNWPIREFVDRLRKASKVTKPNPPRVPAEVTGIFERYLAFSVVAFSGAGRGDNTARMDGGVKLAANWQRQVMRPGSERHNRTMVTYTMIALIAGTISIAFGALAGLIARHAYEALT